MHSATAHLDGLGNPVINLSINNREAEAQRGEPTCPRPHSLGAQTQKLRTSWPQQNPPNHRIQRLLHLTGLQEVESGGVGWSMWEPGQGLKKQKEIEKVLFPNAASLEKFTQKSWPLQSGGVFHVSTHVELFYALAINLQQRGCRDKAGLALTRAVPR